jgi:transposase InsO family protein
VHEVYIYCNFTGKFPFRINTIQKDNGYGYEFQSKFHWHVQDLGMRHLFIKVGTPQLNGKVERSHLTDKREFYQLLNYTDDMDLNLKKKNGKNFIISIDLMLHLKEKHLMKY